jgi:hypothetical protein
MVLTRREIVRRWQGPWRMVVPEWAPSIADRFIPRLSPLVIEPMQIQVAYGQIVSTSRRVTLGVDA